MRRTLAIGAALILAGAAGSALGQGKTLHQERSLYRNIYVNQDGDERCLLFRARRGLGRESCKLLSNPDKMVFEYTQMMLAGLYVNPQPKRILIIGLGGATIPSAMQSLVPGAQLDVVELDGAVDRVARTYFGFKPGPRTRVMVEDGRVFVKRAGRAGQKYDLVMLDAFESDYIPEHMLTREFLGEVKAIMAPRGVLVANTWSTSGLYDHESVTYRAVFGDFLNMKLSNRIIVAQLGGLPSADVLKKNAQGLEPQFAPRGAPSSFLLPLMVVKPDWDPKARILTDQYSPSNLLQAEGR